MSSRRESKGPFTVAVTDTDSTTQVLTIKEYAGGSVEIPSGSPLTSLTMYACHNSEQTPVELFDKDGGNTTITVAANGCYELPESVFTVPYLAFLGDNTNTITAYFKS